MFIPLHDINPRVRFPLVTAIIVAANALVYALGLGLSAEEHRFLVLRAGAIPAEIATLRDIYPRNLIAPPFTILSSMFLHAGFLHLLGNMWFLWIFGDNVEDRIGRARYLAFYLFTGTVGALAQTFLVPASTLPMIGASGAVAGTLGAYAMLFPSSRVVTLVPIPFLFTTVAVPAWIFLGLWFVGQFFLGDGSGVAWMAHVGGFLAGLGLARIVTPRRLQPRPLDAGFFPPPSG